MSFIALASVLALAAQANPGADLLARHTATLHGADTLSVTFTVAQIPAAPQDYKLVYSKPDSLRIDTPHGFVLTDGKNVWEYTKATNEYTVSEGNIKSVMNRITDDEVFAWAAFFVPDQFKAVRDARAGDRISMRGTQVTPVNFTVDASRNKTATLYIDTSTGVARGASVKAARGGDSSEILVVARDLTLSTDDVTAAMFAFSAPAGAKKVEISAADLSKWYSTVAEGLKVAQATNRLVFVDFGAVW